MRKQLSLLAILAALLLGFGLGLARAEPTQLATHKNWTAYVDGEGANRSCYVATKPTQSQPQGAVRGEVFMSISHRASIRNEVGVHIGYAFSDQSRPYAMIGRTRFQFFTGASLQNSTQEWAWLSNLNQSDNLVQAMKRGSRLVFRGKSRRGTITTDTYSLLGFTKAMAAIDKACS